MDCTSEGYRSHVRGMTGIAATSGMAELRRNRTAVKLNEMDGSTARRLQQQSHELARLIEEAQRIKRQVDQQLSTIRHAGDTPSARRRQSNDVSELDRPIRPDVDES
jgi:hypothetical protein